MEEGHCVDRIFSRRVVVSTLGIIERIGNGFLRCVSGVKKLAPNFRSQRPKNGFLARHVTIMDPLISKVLSGGG
jgi:hypothetical protein